MDELYNLTLKFQGENEMVEISRLTTFWKFNTCVKQMSKIVGVNKEIQISFYYPKSDMYGFIS